MGIICITNGSAIFFVFLFQMEDSISTGQKSLQLLGTPLGVLKAQVEEEVRQSFWTSFAQKFVTLSRYGFGHYME